MKNIWAHYDICWNCQQSDMFISSLENTANIENNLGKNNI
jgi:hypothetical protein